MKVGLSRFQKSFCALECIVQFVRVDLRVEVVVTFEA